VLVHQRVGEFALEVAHSSQQAVDLVVGLQRLPNTVAYKSSRDKDIVSTKYTGTPSTPAVTDITVDNTPDIHGLPHGNNASMLTSLRQLVQLLLVVVRVGRQVCAERVGPRGQSADLLITERHLL
jgi:hypothetical protein